MSLGMAEIRQRLKPSLRDALKARDPVATAALRFAVSANDNPEAVTGPDHVRPHLGVAAAADHQRLGRADEPSSLRAEAEVLASHLDTV